ncbi:MAG: Nif3-like dinuclear metal center hexameric protein [Clostridiales bacterium]|nr:Nif3-like dinuclear metal center hexameric protein [Clostridiales bacterium]
MKLKEIMKIIEEKYPVNLAESWDNVGLMVGDPNQEIKKVLVSIEANEAIIQEAKKEQADLIITHHPFIFKGMKRITTNDFKGRMIHTLIQNGIAVYSMHTNFDIAKDGLNDYFMEVIGLEYTKILDVTSKETLFKIVVYAPKSHEEAVREALAKAGAGAMGNYSDCTYHLDGKGHFKPLDGANPYIGAVGDLETVEEVRIECTVRKEFLDAAIQSMLAVHPYETVAYDVIQLQNTGEEDGIGRIADLPNEMSLEQIAKLVKEKLSMNAIRVVGDLSHPIKKVAVVTGSGADYIRTSMRNGADVLITGDLKYHEAQDAVDAGMCLIDCNHFESENIFKDVMKRFLESKLSVSVTSSQININPFTIL